jgi:hypothetical protein
MTAAGVAVAVAAVVAVAAAAMTVVATAAVLVAAAAAVVVVVVVAAAAAAVRVLAVTAAPSSSANSSACQLDIITLEDIMILEAGAESAAAATPHRVHKESRTRSDSDSEDGYGCAEGGPREQPGGRTRFISCVARGERRK